MQIEIQGIPQSLKSQYAPRLKRAQAELGRWKKLSREAHGKVQRGELFTRSGGFGGTSDEPYGTTDDRTRLLVGHEVIEDGTRFVYIICSFCLSSSCFPSFLPFPNLSRSKPSCLYLLQDKPKSCASLTLSSSILPCETNANLPAFFDPI